MPERDLEKDLKIFDEQVKRIKLLEEVVSVAKQKIQPRNCIWCPECGKRRTQYSDDCWLGKLEQTLAALEGEA